MQKKNDKEGGIVSEKQNFLFFIYNFTNTNVRIDKIETKPKQKE